MPCQSDREQAGNAVRGFSGTLCAYFGTFLPIRSHFVVPGRLPIRAKNKDGSVRLVGLSGGVQINEPVSQVNSPASAKAAAPITAAAGIVRTHATTIRLATFQRTAAALRDAPTPMIAPTMVCVVETGTPR